MILVFFYQLIEFCVFNLTQLILIIYLILLFEFVSPVECRIVGIWCNILFFSFIISWTVLRKCGWTCLIYLYWFDLCWTFCLQCFCHEIFVFALHWSATNVLLFFLFNFKKNKIISFFSYGISIRTSFFFSLTWWSHKLL